MKRPLTADGSVISGLVSLAVMACRAVGKSREEEKRGNYAHTGERRSEEEWLGDILARPATPALVRESGNTNSLADRFSPGWSGARDWRSG